MTRTPILPALADLDHGTEGPLPLGLLRSWAESDRTPATHSRLVAPYLRRGTAVVSDSSGLSRLTEALPPADVLKHVSEANEIVAAHGLAVGGEAIGTWTADDTVMFYPEFVEETRVIDAMISAQIANRANLVQFGMAVHRGEYCHIGGALYGEDADRVEHAA